MLTAKRPETAHALIVPMVVTIGVIGIVMTVVIVAIVAIEIGVPRRPWISWWCGWTILSHGKGSSAHQQGRRQTDLC
jgi:hypothetical protein